MTDETPIAPEAPVAQSTPTLEAAAQQAVDRAEAAATRRRWVTLAEIVGVAGLIIAALGLWMNWSDRRADDTAKQAEKASEAKVRTLVMLKGSVEGGGDRLTLADAGHDVQSIDLQFPTALGPATRTSEDPRINAAWFAPAILKLTDGGPDNQRGRMPVLITARYWDADVERRDTAIYDVLWRTEGRMLRGRVLKIEGLRLRERTNTVARLNAAWARQKPVSAK